MVQFLRRLSLLLLALGLGGPAWGQRENSNWYFGTNAALNFPVGGGAPTPLAGSVMSTYEACASVSNAAGQLQFYSNGEDMWNRNNQVMVGGASLGGHASASQGVAVVRNPGDPLQYYLFSVDAAENQLLGGLKYHLIDMSLQGGLGEVIARRVSVSAPGQLLTEKLTTVPHANGRDTWVLVHGWQNAVFYAYLVTPTGVQTVPVTTAVGPVHSGGGGTFNNSNAVGYLRASASGTRLALGMRDYEFAVFDFNPATGQVSNYIPLYNAPRCYGVAFSPDGRLLYGTSLNYFQIYQYDLQAGSAAAIGNSAIQVASTSNNVGAVQAGPDGKLYVSVLNSPYLAAINSPNVRGTGCNFQANAVSLNGATCQIGLPNFPSSQVSLPVITPAFTFAPGCQGQPTTFAGTLTPALAGATYAWNFGDPASGGANTATGPTPTHTFSAPGTYAVTLTATHATLVAPLTLTQNVTIAPTPVAYLPADTTVCGSPVPLRVRGSWPAGSTFRWQDGSTGPSYTATAAGLYSVTVTSPAGCTGQASVRLTIAPLPTVSLGPDTLVCSVPVVLRARGAWPVGSTFRWQDGSTGPTYTAPAAGLYSVTVTTPAGCTATAARRVGISPVLVLRLPADTLACGSPVVLRVKGNVPAGSTYRWQDGSTGPTYAATVSGTYTVVVASPAGCTGQATTRLTIAPLPTVSLGADTAVCPLGSFVLRASPQPAGTTYRWQDGSTAPTYAAVGPGTYSVEVRSAAGCRATARRVAAPLDCPPLIPNIITPNGDPLNETLVLKNMVAADWHLTIFNRWGRQVYERAQYDNSWNAAGQSAGLYYYLLRHNATGQRLQGWVEVVRTE